MSRHLIKFENSDMHRNCLSHTIKLWRGLCSAELLTNYSVCKSKSMVLAALAHVAAGCNPNANAISIVPLDQQQYSSCSTYCGAFVSKNVVCIMCRNVNDNPHSSPLKVVETLKHGEVTAETTILTCVKMMREDQFCDVCILAGDSEGRIFVWTRNTDGDWKVQSPQSDNQAVSAAAVSALAASEMLTRKIYAAAYSDGTLAVFERREGRNVTRLHQLEFGSKSIMEAVDMMTLVHGNSKTQSILLAAGGVDGKVHLLEVTDSVTELLELSGHGDWIRSLAFEKHRGEVGDTVLLASASQDERIRLWKITTSERDAAMTRGSENNPLQAISRHLLYTGSFDALLQGHDDWVTSVQWIEHGSALLTSSMDNTLILWKRAPDTTELWSPSIRVGELGGNGLLSAGLLSSLKSRLDLISLGFGGQLERWEQQPAPSNSFLPSISVNGHGAEVSDLSWSPRGDYLASVSFDQTARILAPFNHARNSFQEWYEISRAQVHGYEINCACFVLREREAISQFVSGADEKILRVFEAPDMVRSFIHFAQNDKTAIAEVPYKTDLQARKVPHAYQPELSLTNKPPQIEKSIVDNDKDNGYAKLCDEILVPVGDCLSRRTLWPEQHKLYGHGNELLSVTSSNTGDLIASACKSREEKFAAVRLWNTLDWSEAQQPLIGHKSSVVQLAFSQNDQYLLSVSKDRHFCLYERQQSPEQQFVLLEHVKAHKRIIWSCSWAPDSAMFALGSRDQSISLWWLAQGIWCRACAPVCFEAAVTAVAFAPCPLSENADLLAVGLETGAIQFFTIMRGRDEHAAVICTSVGNVEWKLSPSSAVLRLAWRPTICIDELLLAAASSDSSVRVFAVDI